MRRREALTLGVAALLCATSCRRADEHASLPRVRISVNGVEGGKGSTGITWLNAIAPGIEKTLEAAGTPVRIEVVGDGGSDESFKSRLVLDLSAGTGADIMSFDAIWTAEAASADLLEPLDPLVRTWGDWAQYPDSMRRMGDYRGRVFMVPLLTDVRGIYYRKDLFEKAGLPREWTPRSWSDIYAAGERLKALPDVIPIQWNGGSAFGEASTMQGFYLVLLSAGGDLYDTTSNRWIADSPALRRTLAFYRTIYLERRLGDVALQLDPKGRDRSFERFRDGRIGIYPEGTYMWIDVLKPGGPWGLANRDAVVGWAPMPGGGEAGDPPLVSISGGGGFIVNKRSPHKALAWRVLAAMNSAASLDALMCKAPFIAARRDVLDSPAFKTDPELTREVAAALPVTRFRPGFPLYPRVSELVGVMTDQILNGASTDEALSAYGRALRDLAGSEQVIDVR
ncbi:MAG: extracellular solute-binding protein [Proteobacteria bacterium]|nr:extracellular solute-binding protein [Pseudomonadota bacterium]